MQVVFQMSTPELDPGKRVWLSAALVDIWNRNEIGPTSEIQVSRTKKYAGIATRWS